MKKQQKHEMEKNKMTTKEKATQTQKATKGKATQTQKATKGKATQTQKATKGKATQTQIEAKKKVTEILVKSGADIKAKNKMGKDPAQIIVLNINIEPPRRNWNILLLILQIIALIIP